MAENIILMRKQEKHNMALLKLTNGYTYYFQEDGKYLTGLQVLEDDAYYFSSGGVMMTGYRKQGQEILI